MALELEAPSVDSLESHAAAQGIRLAPNPEAEAAVELLEADAEETAEESSTESLASQGVEGEPSEATEAATQVTETPNVNSRPTIMLSQPSPSPHLDGYARRRADYLRQKDILQEQISALMIEQSKLKEQAKRCKKESEVYVEQLNELIEAWENASREDEFPVSALAGGCGLHQADRAATEKPQSEPASQQEGGDGTGGEPRNGNAEPDAEPDAEQYESVLRGVSLESLGVGGKLLEKLTEEGIISIWGWEDLRKGVSLGRAEWPKGVGEKKRDDIDARIGDWIAKNSHRWTPRGTVEAVNDAVEQRQDAERAAEVAESQPPVVSPAAVGIDDL